MRLTFGLDFDGGAWPGALAGRNAVAGELWVGPTGLLGTLETGLGLGGPSTPEIVRIAGLVPAIRSHEGFWSESAERSPLATARALLRLRDRLWTAGWRGEPVAPRLRDLAEVTAEAAPGDPDRLQAVAAALARREAGVEALELCETEERHPALWRRVFQRLAEQGARVEHRRAPIAARVGDLEIARQRGGELSGDGSLQLVRPYGVLAAADATAAWLASLPELEDTVVVDGDPVLDEALERFGLPSLGTRETVGDAPLGQVLAGALALAWEPPDPVRVVEWLLLPDGPLPQGLRSRLAEALHEWPAVGSPSWEAAIEVGLGELGDEGYRERVATRLKGLLSRRSTGSELPREEVVRRAGLVKAWATGRLAVDPEREEFAGVVRQCALLVALLEASGLEALSEPQVARFASLAAGGVAVRPRREARAGLAAVACPGALAGPAAQVVWWGFRADRAPRVGRSWLAPAEREALAAAGVELPTLAEEAEALAERWRRPLDLAASALLLVCPRTDERGDEVFPHPLWDDVAARCGPGIARVEATEPRCAEPPPRYRPEAATPPAPRAEWTAPPALLGPRDRESPSALEKLLGCSLAWALRYHARLRPGLGVELGDGPRALGSLLHEAVEEALAAAPATAEEAAESAGRLLREMGPRRVARLFRPGAEVELEGIERMAEEAARDLHRMTAREAGDLLVEEWLEGEVVGLPVGGRVDLAAPGRWVIDLKFGSGSYRRKELQAGAYLALAVYAHLLRASEDAPWPAVAYYVLAEQALLTPEAGGLEAGEALPGPGLEEVWRGLRRAIEERRAELAAGTLRAPGAPDDGKIESHLAGTVLTIAPPCTFCDFAGLCGRTFAAMEGAR